MWLEFMSEDLLERDGKGGRNGAGHGRAGMVLGGGGRERGMLRWHADGWVKTRILLGLVCAAILLGLGTVWLVDRPW